MSHSVVESSETVGYGPRVITALDFAHPQQARELVARLDPALCRLKVGKQLFTLAGPGFVQELQGRGFDVFLDLKFHDIPNTVAGACRAAAELGVWMVNVHASGGRRMLDAAREAIPGSDTQLIAVTVLTSTTEEELAASGITRSLSEQVDFLASASLSAGLNGVVCSPLESSRIRKLCGKDFQLVTPGVRPAGSAPSDQRRVMTPADAVAAGSDFLVIGRPVTGAENPLSALRDINQSLAAGNPP